MFLNASTRVGGNMKKQRIKAIALSTVLTAGAVFTSASYADQALDSVMAVGQSKVVQAKKSQARINKLQDDTSSLMDKHTQVSKTIEGLRVYNSQMEKQLASQRDIMGKLEGSIGQITVIQRQVQPLVLEMLETITQFIELDAPYNKDVRLGRAEKLSGMMSDADVTIAEKFRQVLEIYSIESEYARKVDTYKDELSIGGESLNVDVLAIGRVALMFQTSDGSRTGVWDRTSKSWQDLDAGSYGSEIRNAIRMAQKKAQNDIMRLPISAPEVAK